VCKDDGGTEMSDEKIKPVAWYDQINKDFSHVERIGWLPLYPESALTQAREEGRIAGMREAAEICTKTWKFAPNDRASGYWQNTVSHGCIVSAEAITRASEGK